MVSVVELTDTPAGWPVRERSDLFRDHWVMALRADTITTPDADPGDPGFRRLVLEHPGAAVIVAIDDQDRVCCLRQYRHPGGKVFVELPAGLCDQGGEDPLEVARRELAEEAGLVAARWTPLGAAYPSPGISAERIEFFVAQGLTPAPDTGFVHEHEEAQMELGWVPAADLLAAVVAGTLTNAPTMLAVLLASARGLLPGGVPSGAVGR